MSYCAFITTLKNVRKHPNADSLQLADCFGFTSIIDMSMKEGDLVIYFPIEGQLSEEYCAQNNLTRDKGGFLHPQKRNIKILKLRGEYSEGLVMPLSSVEYTGVKNLCEGDSFTCLNRHEICQKFIPSVSQEKEKKRVPHTESRKPRYGKEFAPLFKEHSDTSQLAYYLDDFKAGDHIEITLKMHGTNGRTAFVPVLKGYKRTFLDILFKRKGTPIYEYDYVTGSRRVILGNEKGGFYGDNAFRKDSSDLFKGKLHRGETVYYEIVGYVNENTPIMISGQVPLEYQKQYGNTMDFSYGCRKGEHRIFVFRMTFTSEDGYTIEYPPDLVRQRCAEMNIDCVPVFWEGIIPDCGSSGEWVKFIAEGFYDGPDPVGKTHVREGVVCRIINRPHFTAYKHKNPLFKEVTGIAIDKKKSFEGIDEELVKEF